MVLVGTKIDLREDSGTIEKLAAKGQIPVTFEQGMDLMREIGGNKYVECSSLTLTGLHNVFQEAIRLVICAPRLIRKKHHECMLL